VALLLPLLLLPPERVRALDLAHLDQQLCSATNQESEFLSELLVSSAARHRRVRVVQCAAQRAALHFCQALSAGACSPGRAGHRRPARGGRRGRGGQGGRAGVRGPGALCRGGAAQAGRALCALRCCVRPEPGLLCEKRGARTCLQRLRAPCCTATVWCMIAVMHKDVQVSTVPTNRADPSRCLPPWPSTTRGTPGSCALSAPAVCVHVRMSRRRTCAGVLPPGVRSVDYEPDDDDDEGNAYENWTIAAELELTAALGGLASLCGASHALRLTLMRAGALGAAERLVRRHVDAHEAPQREAAAARALDLVLDVEDAIGGGDAEDADEDASDDADQARAALQPLGRPVHAAICPAEARARLSLPAWTPGPGLARACCRQACARAPVDGSRMRGEAGAGRGGVGLWPMPYAFRDLRHAACALHAQADDVGWEEDGAT
jgi:hypothetical protein